MELESSYQLLGVLRDDGIRTYSAVEIASGQALQVHLFSSPNPEADRALYKALRSLPVNKRRELLEMGMEGDKPYIVTETLPNTITPREWLTKLAGVSPAKAANPVMLAGSWKTGTPIPEELIRASQSSHPPKPPPPPPKPAELSPDYTRVMRLPQALGGVEPEARSARAPELGRPVGPPAIPPIAPLGVQPPPLPPEIPASQPEIYWGGPSPEPALPEPRLEVGMKGRVPAGPPEAPPELDGKFLDARQQEAAEDIEALGKLGAPPELDGILLGSQPAAAVKGTGAQGESAAPPELGKGIGATAGPTEDADEFDRMFGAQPVPPAAVQPPSTVGQSAPPAVPEPVPLQPASREPGEFTRMFLGTKAPEPAAPVVAPPVPTPAVPAAPVPAPPVPAAAVPAPAIPAQATPHEPGEFTRMFLASQPPEVAPPVVPAQPLAQQNAPQQPGEFTIKFLASHPVDPAPPALPAQPLVANQPGEFTSQFPAAQPPLTAAQPARHAVPEEEATRVFQTMPAMPATAQPPSQPAFPQQALPQQALPSQALASQAFQGQPSSDESTRLFQAVPPSAPPPGPAKEPGEFTRMFPSARPDSPSAPGPSLPVQALPAQAASIQPAGNQQAGDGPSEFTRFFQSPMYPTPAGNQRVPSSPQSAGPLGPVEKRPSAQASEFTQMFGNPNRPNASAAPPPPLMGTGGAGSATGAFSVPKPSYAPPPPNASGPGEFTRMMSASAPPTLGQQTAKPGAPDPVPAGTKSMMPLYIIGGAVLLAIILIILFFMLRHG